MLTCEKDLGPCGLRTGHVGSWGDWIYKVHRSSLVRRSWRWRSFGFGGQLHLSYPNNSASHADSTSSYTSKFLPRPWCTLEYV